MNEILGSLYPNPLPQKLGVLKLEKKERKVKYIRRGEGHVSESGTLVCGGREEELLEHTWMDDAAETRFGWRTPLLTWQRGDVVTAYVCSPVGSTHLS